MIISLFAIEFILASLTVFTTLMLSHKFNGIEKSLGIYGNAKAYRTQSKVAFIDKVLSKYKECADKLGEDLNVESIVKAELYKEYIGKFSFTTVKSIALKTTRVMWGIIVLQGGVAFAMQTVHEVATIVMITTSILLSISIEMFKFIKGIEDQSDVIIMLVQDYITNVYPAEVRKKMTNQEIARLKKRVMELEEELHIEELSKPDHASYQEEKLSNDELSMQDIAKLIGIFQ